MGGIFLVPSSAIVDNDNAGTSPVIPWPAALLPGDVTYVMCSGAIASAPTMVTSGYTALGTALSFNGGNAHMQVFSKVQGNTPDANATMTGSGSASLGTGIVGYALRGVDRTTPEDATPTTATGNSTNPDPASITTATAGAMVLAFAASCVADPAVSAPSGYTNLANGQASVASPISFAGSLKTVASPSAENPGTFTSWNTGQWGTITAAAKPGTEASYRAHTNNTGSGTTVTITKPTGTVDGDAMLAVVIHGASTTVSAVPSGWTLEYSDTMQSGVRRCNVYRKIASGEGASWAWTLSGSTTYIGAAVSAFNADPTTPFCTGGGQVNASGTSVIAPSITPSGAGVRIFFGFANNNTATFTAPSTTVEVQEQAAASFINLEIAVGLVASAGATGTATATLSGGVENIGFQIVIHSPIPAVVAGQTSLHCAFP